MDNLLDVLMVIAGVNSVLLLGLLIWTGANYVFKKDVKYLRVDREDDEMY